MYYVAVVIDNYVTRCKWRSLSAIVGTSWSRSYGSWIYTYLCNKCLSTLKLRVRTPFMARCTQYNIIWSSLSVTGDRSVVSPGTPVSSTNKTYHHGIAEILLKIAFTTITLTPKPFVILITRCNIFTSQCISQKSDKFTERNSDVPSVNNIRVHVKR